VRLVNLQPEFKLIGIEMKTIYFVAALTLSVVLSGCAISQNVEQAHIPNAAELCVIENDRVREGFLPELLGVLDEKGISYIVTGNHVAHNGCEWTLTYTARWSWDLAIYLSYAEIKVFKNGVLDGQAVYDSRGGSANMSKFIDAEPKIRELVEELMQREQDVGKVANRNASQLRAVSAEDKEDCEFIKSITKGAGGSGDASQYVESAMNAALTQAANHGADSYFVVDVDTTDSGASVVLEALRCN
jgi:hypothetical protein